MIYYSASSREDDMSKHITKPKTRDSALPRRRNAGALALQDPRHRHRVIPDKRAANKPTTSELLQAELEPLPGNTLCPKIGAAQWTCTRDECTCHLKDRAPITRPLPETTP